MTGAGKTVLISTLAMKMSQMADQGIFLAPIGENRRQTLRYVQENWQTLNSGKWPPSTPAGELIHLEWELTTKNNAATVRFADCAGQDIHAIFSQEQFDYNALTYDQREVFDYLRSANVLIFLINMEDVLGRSPKQALENSLDVDQMFYVLNQKANFPRKTALVLSQFDKYRDELKAKYDNNLLEYLRANFPQLHGQYIKNPNFAVIPVAAVETTQTIIENGMTKQVPVENFSSFNLKKLISWIAEAVDELSPLMQQLNESAHPGTCDNSNTNAADPDANSQEYADHYGCSVGLYAILSFILAILFLRSVVNNPVGRESLCLFPSLTPENCLPYILVLLAGVSCLKTILLFFETRYLMRLRKEKDKIKYIQIENKLRNVMYVYFSIFSGIVFYILYAALMNLPEMVYYLCIIPSLAGAYWYFKYSIDGYSQWRSAQYSMPRSSNQSVPPQKFETFTNASIAIVFFYILIAYSLIQCCGMTALESMFAVNIVLLALPVILWIDKILKRKRSNDSQ